jgi:enoyl-CoA hydratase
MTGKLVVRVEDSTAIVTLSNPPWNALDPSMVDDMRQALDDLTRTDVRVLIVTGEGGIFSVGADVRRLANLDMEETRELVHRAQECFDWIERLPKPVIAAINGDCLGGGLELALACHLRILAAGAVVGLPEVTVGLVPGLGGTQRLPRLLTPGQAYEMILTGRRVKAEDALRMGLVNAVVPRDSVRAHADRLARRLARKSSGAMVAAMRCLAAGVAGSREGYALEARLFAELSQTADLSGSAASLEVLDATDSGSEGPPAVRPRKQLQGTAAKRGG